MGSSCVIWHFRGTAIGETETSSTVSAVMRPQAAAERY